LVGLSSPFCKNILIYRTGKSGAYFSHPAAAEGRCAIVTNVWRRDAVDAGVPKDEGCCLRTCEVVWSRRLEVGVKLRIDPDGSSAVTVSTKPDHRGEHEVAVKTIARGMPGDLGCIRGD
jgi:hypothetical protein